MGRNAIEVFDPSLARRQTQLQRGGMVSNPHFQGIKLSAEVEARMAAALQAQAIKIRAREEERRKRDPTYRPDAIDLSTLNLKPFDKYTDYYARLGVGEFASVAELKKAFLALSLRLHPDKLAGATTGELAAAKAKYQDVSEAFEILSDLATRREYDRARDKLEAEGDAGLTDVGRNDKPPPNCIDLPLSLAELFKGCRKEASFHRREFMGTQWEKGTLAHYSCKVYPGEHEGATIWFRGEGDCHAPDLASAADPPAAPSPPLCRYHVAAEPGVRRRAQPSLGAATVGVLRRGAVLRGRAAAGGWVWLEGGGYALSRGQRGARLLRLIDADDETDASSEEEERSGGSSATGGGGRGGGGGAAAKRKEAAAARDAAAKEARRAERARCGAMRAAEDLLRCEAGKEAWRAHCGGAPLVAVGSAAELLCQNEPPRSTADRPGCPTCSPQLRWPRVLPFLLRQPRADAWHAGRRAAAWRELRAAVIRTRLDGPAAVGLPPGSVLGVLPGAGFSVRAALGSAAPPHRLTLPGAELATQRREARRAKRRVEAERRAVLAAIEDEYSRIGGQAAEELRAARRAGGAYGGTSGVDLEGRHRGQCPQCNACPGYAMPTVVTDHRLVQYCCHCGCLASRHEELKAPAREELART